ncbi:MAG: ABC transporter, partial [Actinomycetota bacterium]
MSSYRCRGSAIIGFALRAVGSFDPMTRGLTLWEEVRRLNDAGTTVLLTTQYLEEADQLADRIAIIDHGHIVRQGVPRDLKAQVGSPTLSISVDRDHME